MSIMGNLVRYHHENGYDVPALIVEPASTHVDEDDDGNETKTTVAGLFIMNSSTMVTEGTKPGQYSNWEENSQYRGMTNAVLREEIRRRNISGVPNGATKAELVTLLEEDDVKE